MKQIVVVLFSAILIGCSGGGSGDKPDTKPPVDLPDSECVVEGAVLKTVTYNVGLAPGMLALATPRVPAVVEVLADLDADVICLQEVWTDEGESAVRGILEARGMEVYTVSTKGENETGTDTCTAEDIQPALECVEERCQGLAEEDITRCAISDCKDAAAPLFFKSRGCLNCIVSQPGKSMEEIQEVCVEGDGASRLFDGRNSLLLASRYPMTNKEGLRLKSSNANRVALMATIEGFTTVPIEIGCVHIAASAPIPPSHEAYSSWAEEKLGQWRQFADRLDDRSGDGPVILLGDMNFDTSSDENVWPTASEEYGYTSPASDVSSPFCTACQSNYLKGGPSEPDEGNLIDLALTLRTEEALKVDDVYRFADEPVEVINHDGEPETTHPSDHFGTGVDFECK